MKVSKKRVKVALNPSGRRYLLAEKRRLGQVVLCLPACPASGPFNIAAVGGDPCGRPRWRAVRPSPDGLNCPCRDRGDHKGRSYIIVASPSRRLRSTYARGTW